MLLSFVNIVISLPIEIKQNPYNTKVMSTHILFRCQDIERWQTIYIEMCVLTCHSYYIFHDVLNKSNGWGGRGEVSRGTRGEPGQMRKGLCSGGEQCVSIMEWARRWMIFVCEVKITASSLASDPLPRLPPPPLCPLYFLHRFFSNQLPLSNTLRCMKWMMFNMRDKVTFMCVYNVNVCPLPNNVPYYRTHFWYTCVCVYEFELVCCICCRPCILSSVFF